MTAHPSISRRPTRKDAARNFDKLIEAAREVFVERGAEATLEEIAKRAGVGIGTLYRNFPTRQHLLEAVYIEEMEAIVAAADDLDDLEPWEALTRWLHQYVGYAATKREVGQELMSYAGQDAEVFGAVKQRISAAGDHLIEQAQAAGIVRDDVTFIEVGRLIGGVARVPGITPEETARMLDLVLDGLRYRA